MRLRRPLPAVQGDTLHIVGVGDNRIGKVRSEIAYPVVTLVATYVGCAVIRAGKPVSEWKLMLTLLKRDDSPFPASLLELQRLFPVNAACAVYLEKA